MTSIKKTGILLVEDEADIAEFVMLNLRYSGYDVLWKESAEAASAAMQAGFSPHLILLDWMLPGVSGFNWMTQLRRSGVILPVIMITARHTETDKIAALDAGIDDYLLKPFSVNELLARIKAVLRRAHHGLMPGQSVIASGDVVIDVDRHQVLVADTPVRLSAQEFKLLKFSVENEGRAFSRGTLLTRLWGHSLSIEERTVDVHVKRLRDMLGEDGSARLETVRGVGYRWKD